MIRDVGSHRPQGNTATRTCPTAEPGFDIGFTDDSLERMVALFALHGDTYRVFSPARAAYIHVVHHPDDVQRVLVTNQRNYTKGVGLDRVRLLLGNGSMTSEGEASKRQRAMLHPLFHRRMVAGFACSVAAANDRLIDRWSGPAASGTSVNVTDDVGRNDNLFAIGATSLSLIQIHERIDRQYPGTVALSDLFEFPTLAGLALHIERRLARPD